tara:strand:+ start:392 stop:499 length:108 start_codon:yes stop_codon:yes gene_type:complete
VGKPALRKKVTAQNVAELVKKAEDIVIDVVAMEQF